MEKVRPWCGHPSDRGRLRNRNNSLHCVFWLDIHCFFITHFWTLLLFSVFIYQETSEQTQGSSHTPVPRESPFILYETASDGMTTFSHECGQRQDDRTALSSSWITDVKSECEPVDDNGEDDVLCDPQSIHVNDVGSAVFRDMGEFGGTRRKDSLTFGDERPFVCYICAKAYRKCSGLTSHIRTHMQNSLHTCGMCSKRFTQHSHLRNHIRTHTGEKPYKCEVCPKQYTMSSHLKRHVLTHADIRQYTCRVCHKHFTQSSSRDRHLLVHTGEKSHACDVCHKRFTQRCSLKNHMLTHTGERAHECDICRKRFSQRGSLKRHRLTHSGIKVHECEVCRRRFAERGSLIKHMTRSHTMKT